jgi:hypothetical protein
MTDNNENVLILTANELSMGDDLSSIHVGLQTWSKVK